jgi:molybdopterin/thiamine biosynthesis adenylyltransferase
MPQLTRQSVGMIMIPTEIVQSSYTGDLFGLYHNETEIFNVLGRDMMANFDGAPQKVATIFDKQLSEDFVHEPNVAVGIRQPDGTIHFTSQKRKLVIREYSLIQNIFSRNTGILESSLMQESTACIIGCGSVGSLVAAELARSGVGKFVLIDSDVLEYHNLCRHQASIRDVGDYKTSAVRRLIHKINPSAQVVTHVGHVEDLSQQIFADALASGRAIVVGAADDRGADVYANKIATLFSVPFISIGLWTRAFAGEIFYHIPNGSQPCYECALVRGALDDAPRAVNRHVYVDQEDLAAVNFEPGISVDISYVTTIGIKLILDLLNRNNDGYTPRLLGSLQPLTFVCNTNNTAIGGEMAEIFSYPLQVTTSLETAFQPPCPQCKYANH